MMKRLLLVAMLVTGCGPQPWSPAVAQAAAKALQGPGSSPARAACIVLELEKRMSEAEFQRNLLESQAAGRVTDRQAALLTEVVPPCNNL